MICPSILPACLLFVCCIVYLVNTFLFTVGLAEVTTATTFTVFYLCWEARGNWKHAEEKQWEFAEVCGFDNAFLWKKKTCLQYVKWNRLLLKHLITEVLGLTRHRLLSKPFFWPLPSLTPHELSSRRAVIALLSHQLPTSPVGWNRAALFIHGKEGRESCWFSLLLCSRVPREAPQVTGASQGNTGKVEHPKRYKQQWEMEGFSVPLYPLGLDIQRGWKFGAIIQWHTHLWYALLPLRHTQTPQIFSGIAFYDNSCCYVSFL